MRYLPLLVTLAGMLATPLDPWGRADELLPPVFERDVRPVFVQKCGTCRSQEMHKAGLDLTTVGGVRRGGESGEAAVTDSLEESPLWSLIEAGEMPPEGQLPLAESERELIRQCIGWRTFGVSPGTAASHAARRAASRVIALYHLSWCTSTRRWT